MAPRSRSSRLIVIAGWLLASAATRAQAAELSARGPAECADAEELAFRVERSIGMPLAAAEGLRFDVEMEAVAAGHRARIEVRVGSSDPIAMQRVLVASDCEKLASAVSVAVALALGAGKAPAEGAESFEAGVAPGVASERATASRAAPPSAPPSAAAELALPDAGATPAETADGAALVPALSLWLLGDVGSLPSPALGVALGAELGWRRFELRVLGMMLFEQQVEAAGSAASRAGAELELMTASVSGCAAPFGQLRAALSPLLCLGLELGRSTGVGTGIDFPRRGSALWVAPLAQVGVVWSMPQTSLQVSSMLLGAAPLNRDEFALAGIGSVHQPPALIGRWSLGLGMQFD